MAKDAGRLNMNLKSVMSVCDWKSPDQQIFTRPVSYTENPIILHFQLPGWELVFDLPVIYQGNLQG